MSRKPGQSPVDIPGRPAATRRVAACLLTNNENRERTGIFCAEIMGLFWDISRNPWGFMENLPPKKHQSLLPKRRVPARCVSPLRFVPPGSSDSSPQVAADWLIKATQNNWISNFGTGNFIIFPQNPRKWPLTFEVTKKNERQLKKCFQACEELRELTLRQSTVDDFRSSKP